MYESPIEKIYGEIETQIIQHDEEMIMKAVRQVNINVDKKELIKALQYDRNQYTKGYMDGQLRVLEDIKKIMDENKYPEYLEMNLYEYMNNNELLKLSHNQT